MKAFLLKPRFSVFSLGLACILIVVFNVALAWF